MDKNAEQDIGRGAEVEARQAEDGTFELVVSDSAAHAAVSEEAAQRHLEAESAPSEAGGITPERLKRVGLIALFIALIAGGLIYALSGAKEESTDTAQASQARNDGFQPYGGGGTTGAKTRGASDNEAIDRLKAADRDDDEHGVDRRPEPMEERVSARPSNSERDYDDEPEDDDEWELDEAELLEEARAVERAEKAAEQAAEESDMDEDEDELDEQQDEGASGQEENPEPVMPITPINRRGRRLVAPQLEQRTTKKLNRFQQARPAKTRPPLRGMRGLQRREDQHELPSGGQGVDDEEDYWNEGEEDDRVPEFGRD